MVLVDVDVVDAEATEARLAVLDDQLRIGVGVWLAAAPEPDLGGDNDLIAGYGREEAGEQRLAVALAVDIGGVEEGDTALPCTLDGGQRLAVVHRSPGVATDSPEPEADRRHP